MTTFQEGMPHMKGDWVNNLSQLIGFFPYQMSNLGPVIVWAAGRQGLDEQTFLWRLFRRSLQLLLLSIIISCNMQSLHCLKSQPPSCLPRSNIKLGTWQWSHISTPGKCLHAWMQHVNKWHCDWLVNPVSDRTGVCRRDGRIRRPWAQTSHQSNEILYFFFFC